MSVNISFVFLGNGVSWKNAFEIYWPLVVPNVTQTNQAEFT